MKAPTMIGEKERRQVVEKVKIECFRAKDICQIIRACKVNGVLKFALKDLSIEFKDQTEQINIKMPEFNYDGLSSSVDQESPEIDESEINMQMALENPVEWEKSQLDGVANGSL